MRNWITHWKRLSTAEQGLTNLMIAWVLLFFSGVIVFWFFPVEVVRGMRTVTGWVFDLSRFPELPAPSERFWSALALSLMTTLTVLCAFVAYDVQRYLHFTVPVLVSKAASTFFFLYFYFTEDGSFAYLGGALLSDGPIFVCTLIFYLFAAGARRKALAGGGGSRLR